MTDGQPKRYEARVVNISESGRHAFASRWRDIGMASSVRDVAIICHRGVYGTGFGPKKTIEVREVGTDDIHRATVQPRIEYEVKFEERGDG